MGVETKQNGLFEAVMTPTTKRNNDLLSEPETSGIWHASISHSGATKMPKTIPIVTGMGLRRYKMYRVCKICELCKSKSHPRPSRSSELNNATKNLDLSH